ncbi:mechanosensitive ion channel family protein [Canibacter sp. lx-72]|uniref:mechanosensitive ion channel family protein n=1 Tax=Canibacter zhuwentaonis TaxID=2837491 RepID=UPI001BDD7B8E|nr:mechanosensitive ion channel family protein [Canibacter zhuwentaonis]MBT1017911.1 mechanosensitive ion channel family protein [Canibacter zhuwentaonis]
MSEFWQQVAAFFAENDAAWRVLLIMLGAIIASWVLRILIQRGVNKIVRGVKRSQATDSTQEISTSSVVRERAIQRTRTLGAVGRSIVTWVVGIIAVVLIAREFGIDLTAILASAGFVGAALAFGAQSIVKDLLNGIFMVFEDQLGVGDWVTIGNIEGTVEDLGVRITQVRGLDGTLWFVRNGEILQLGNSSQGHGQAIIDITLKNSENIDEAQEVMLMCANNVINTPELRRKVTGNPDMWGVQSVYGDRVTIRFTIRTRAEAHWEVQRAVRKEIKAEFGRRGIEMASQIPEGLL